MDDDDDKDLEKILGDDKPSQGRVQADAGEGDEKQTETETSGSEAKEPSAKTGRQTAEANDSIEEAIMYAKKYLEDLLSFFGLNMDIYATTEDHEVIELDVPSTHLNGFLIGHNGETMRALQFTISSALKSQNFKYTRVNVDIADYKRQRANRLVQKAEAWFKEVKDSGKPKELEPMNPAERRVLHKAAEDYGLETESVGEGRNRHIVLKPGAATTATKAKDEEKEE